MEQRSKITGRLRKMEFDDIPAVFLIETQSVLTQTNEFNRPIAPCAKEEFAKFVRKRKRYFSVVFDCGKKITAFMIFDRIEMEIINLAVRKDARAKGIGSYILGCLKEDCKDKPFTVKVRETNERGINFFCKKNGFHHNCFLRDFFGKTDPPHDKFIPVEGAVELQFGKSPPPKGHKPINRIKMFES